MNERSESKTLSAPCYVAIATQSSQIGPESWEAYPITKTMTRETTIGELADWYKSQFPNAQTMQGVNISQAHNSRIEACAPNKETTTTTGE